MLQGLGEWKDVRAIHGAELGQQGYGRGLGRL